MDLAQVREIEAAALTTWPALQVAHDGLWLWRAARGYTKRANSIQCLDPADGEDADRRLARLADLSTAHRLPPIFRVTPLTSEGAIAAIDRKDWALIDESLVLALDMPAGGWPAVGNARTYDPLNPDWFRVQSAFGGYDEHTIEILQTLLALMACETCGVLVFDPDGAPAAAALGGLFSGIAVFANVVTREDVRGRGFGRAVMQAVLGWAHEAGAARAALQVEAVNAPALSLYASLGFEEAYRYHYRVPRELIR